MKIPRVRLVIILILVAGRGFNANAEVTESNLYFFGSSPTDGETPSGLVQGSDGNFYGTTENGGTSPNCFSGCGTVFRISPSGSETNLHSFVSYPTDGAIPYAGLVQGSDGNFYGTTGIGGTSNISGSVFRISPSGSETILYSFGNTPNDGDTPYAGLVQGKDGNFYGTTEGGTKGLGTVFRISPSSSYTNLYTFGSVPTDGNYPAGELVQGSDGNFYGTTKEGGANDDGTVFRISPSGTETTLYSFVGSPTDGYYPQAGLVQGSDGNFYGTASAGGTSTNCGSYGCGTIFRISPNGSESNLYFFGNSPTDGSFPAAGLVQGSDGNFYGTTENGGTYGKGTVFRFNPNGGYTNLYSFGSSPTDGYLPNGLVQDTYGNFYGTTQEGGANDDGTVFKLSVPLSSPPNEIAGIRIAGTNIVFSIPSIASETYQLQFSSSMNPTNWSNVSGAFVSNSIGAMLTLTNFGGANQSQGFYRFAITP